MFLNKTSESFKIFKLRFWIWTMVNILQFQKPHAVLITLRALGSKQYWMRVYHATFLVLKLFLLLRGSYKSIVISEGIWDKKVFRPCITSGYLVKNICLRQVWPFQTAFASEWTSEIRGEKPKCLSVNVSTFLLPYAKFHKSFNSDMNMHI